MNHKLPARNRNHYTCHRRRALFGLANLNNNGSDLTAGSSSHHCERLT